MGYEGMHEGMVFNALNTDDEIQKINDQLVKLGDRMQAMASTGRDLSVGEQAESERLIREYDRLEGRKDALAAMSASKSTGRVTEPQQVRNNAPRIEHVARKDDYGPFSHPGDFFQAVKNSSARGGSVDPRLVMNAPTTYSSEGIGQDGGYSVPQQWSTQIWQKVTGETSLLRYCNVVNVTSNSYTRVVDANEPWGTSGIRAFWKQEGSQLTQTKPSLSDETKRLSKLTALVPVTEELMEDSPMLDSYLRSKVETIFGYEVNRTILQGSGVGEPLGILNSASLVSVAKEAGQAADSILSENIFKMWSRLAPGHEGTAVWLMNKDILPSLFGLALSVGTGGVSIYLPAGNAAGYPFQTLMGRPIIFTQACETLGDKGDIVLCDLSQYQVILKTGGLRADVSMELFFDYDMSCYRFVLRIDGAPMWNSPATARDGSTTLSPYVALDERS